MKPIISIKNVNFTYNRGKDNEFQALINVSVDVYPEEFIIIFGPSGCGKSTLLNIIAGLEIPDNGEIMVFEKNLREMSKKEFVRYHRRQVGMIYQAYNLITSLSVLDNVALPQIFMNVRKRRREKWGKTLLERFGILKQAKKIPTELSGGQQQRIGIARAIVNNPQMVLGDEPVGNLDSVSAKNVLTILQDLNEKEKKTVIVVTHNPEFLEYGDRIIHMKDGIITGETVNRDRHKHGKTKEPERKPPSSEIQDLMRAYHGLSPEQINILIMPYKAKVFSNHFITSRNMEETKTLEEVIQRRLLGTITLEECFDILNRPSEEGGVGFDIRTAEKIIRRINRIIRIAYYIYQKERQKKDDVGKHLVIGDEEKAEKLTDYLLKTCYTDYYDKLSIIQSDRLKKAVSDRLHGAIHKSEFFAFLDLPFSEGGVGLNSKTARAITEEIELILILGFGIVRKKEEDTPQAFEQMLEKKARNIGQVISKEYVKEKKDEPSKNLEQEPKRAEQGSVESSEKQTGQATQEKEAGTMIDDKKLAEIADKTVESMGDISMKDFAEAMKKTIAASPAGTNNKKIAQAVEKAIISRS